MTKLQWKIILILALVLLSGWLLYPTAVWYTMSDQERSEAERQKDPLLGKTLNLGLDLRGGIHLLLELDTSRLDPQMQQTDALDRAQEIIRNRVDQFGVAEPLILRQGEKWLVIQLPGIKDPERAKDLVGKTALLEFRLVDDSEAFEKIISKIQELGLVTIWDAQRTLDPRIASLVPLGQELLPGKDERYYLVQSTAELTGAALLDAKVQFGGGSNYTGFPEVSLRFNAEGAKIFSQVTGLNIDKNLAIVLDGVVQSAPVIRSRIPNGQAVIEGNFSEDEAKNLAIVLRAGALPAPVRIIEERVVGPSLGEDSIKAGVRACIVGGLLVILFMAGYYKLSGLMADLALVLNLVLLLAAMSYFHATLTLPGIAGIILTIGMAVDANVLIFERIRDELRTGKTVYAAVDQGYNKAFSAIFDGNLTTLIAAVFLFQFGTGPVKGFAVTLIIGLAVSMFTAITVTRTIYDIILQGRKVTKLSI